MINTFRNDITSLVIHVKHFPTPTYLFVLSLPSAGSEPASTATAGVIVVMRCLCHFLVRVNN